jgi:Type II secretion system (T2SS), protein E, N-terminal domain
MPFLEKRFDGRKIDSVWGEEAYGPGTITEQRRSCGNPECSSAWAAPWRSRKRPVFEGQWGCSGRCVLALVRAAVRRELGDGTTGPQAHRHRVPLGLLMLAQGWITHPQLRRALEAQRESGSGRIGDWLVSECGLEAEQITRGLSMQWNCPVLPMKGFAPEMMALVMPRVFVEEFSLLPLRVAGSRILYLAFEDRLDAAAALALERMTELKVESGLMDGKEFQPARRRLLEYESVPAKAESVADSNDLAARITAVLEQTQPMASRLVRLHQYYWLRVWMERDAMSGTGSLPKSSEDMSDFIFMLGGRA